MILDDAMSYRPRYETEEDLSREGEFSRIASEKFRCTFQKMPVRYGLDYAAIRDGKIVGFAEMKIRTNSAYAYPTYMISLTKMMAARDLWQVTGLRSFLMVMWSDAWGYTRLSGVFDDLTFNGRSDRADWQDMEPVMLINMERFRIAKRP